jgi:DNA polymerase III epsilon subunit family exonuclease
MKVLCEVDYCEIENEQGREVPCVKVTCGRCGHQTESFGQHEGSIKRCMILLKEECPNGERNFYDEGNVTNTTGSWDQANGGLAAPTGLSGQAVAPGLFGSPQPAGLTPPGGGGHSAPSSPRKFSAPGSRSGPKPGPVHGGRAPANAPTQSQATITTGSVPRLISENDFCIIKCATTGLSTEKDQIVQIGLCQVDKGRARWRVSVNVKPSIPIPEKASSIHGLTAEKLHFASSFSEIALELIEFIGKRVLVGYNIGKFDVPILTRQLGETLGPVDDVDFLDVLLFERKYAQESFAVNEKQRHGLEDAVRRWGLGDRLSVTHDALNDAKVVWAVFVELCARYPELGQASLADAYEILKAEGTLTAMGLRTAAKFAHLRG